MSDQLKELTLDLKALPGSGLWTGDADMEMSYIKATSILGGLRFWTEALLRSLGERVCADQGRCTRTKEKPDVCACCSVFGCTGLARQFIANASAPNGLTESRDEEVKLSSRTHPNKKGEMKPPYYLFRSGHTGEWTLRLVAQRPSYLGKDSPGRIELPAPVLAALALMLKYGTFGARDQYNCGLMEATAGADALFAALPAVLATLPAGSAKDSTLPDLRDFFFFKGKASLSLSAKTKTPDEYTLCALLRHDIRNVVRATGTGTELRHWFCGQLNEYGTDLNITVLKDGRFYGWGWYPKGHPQYGSAREGVLKAIASFVTGAEHPAVKKAMEGKQDAYKISSGEWKDLRDSSGDWKKALSDLLARNWR